MYILRKIWKPEIYQGGKQRKRYFEGWYFKIVDEAEKHVYAIIPGVSFDKKGRAHSFIQFFVGKEAIMYNIKYKIEDFQYSKKNFEIEIKQNKFSSESLSLDLEEKGLNVRGEIKFENLSPWPISMFRPGAMGPYRFVPFMECYHGVLSFNHKLSGKLTINNKTIDFSNGKGYIEKDYGKSFPSYYLWMQSNHFSSENTSIMVSLANIPWLGSSFDGFIVGFLHEEMLYKFATYTGAIITKLRIKENVIQINFKDQKYRLEVIAEKAEGVNLLSPVEGSMTGRILESITAKINVRLVKLSKKSEELIFEGKGRNAGLDIGGKVEKIKEID